MGYLTILYYVIGLASAIYALIVFIQFLLWFYKEFPFTTLVLVFIIVAVFLASGVIYLAYPDLLVPIDNVLRKGN